MADRVMMFVDGSYLFHSIRTFDPNYRIDYNKLVNRLMEVDPSFRLTRKYYYGSRATLPVDEEQAVKQEKLFDRLRDMKFDLTILELSTVYDPQAGGMRYREKGVDVAIAVDVLTLAHNRAFDVAILVSGDGDFIRLVKAVKQLGQRVMIAAFRHSCAPALMEASDFPPVWIDSFTEDVKLTFEPSDNELTERMLYDATCSVCGAPVRVPFHPDGVRPVYCREHLPIRPVY
ncbi:MAG: NYN domain-containing protein [Bacteroidota bacterium]